MYSTSHLVYVPFSLVHGYRELVLQLEGSKFKDYVTANPE